LPFLIVGSAKVRIFFKLPNKINFIFQAYLFPLPLFNMPVLKRRSVLPNRAAKVAIFSSHASFLFSFKIIHTYSSPLAIVIVSY
jgi:hypothetical protein